MKTQKIEGKTFDEERALYALKDSSVINCEFAGIADGESALKEASQITVEKCKMDLRYPLWHVLDAQILDCTLTENCRAPLWYDQNITIDGCRIAGVKALRECDEIRLKNTVVDSPEFLWKCRKIEVENVEIQNSEYPFFEVFDAKIKNLKMKGKYSFQYCENLEISDSVLDTKDAFWHSKNVTVKNSVVNGEYLGWYSENLRLVDCKIKGTQPFCYCKNLILENCTMENCDLSFERSSVNADVRGKIDSVKNALFGKICADEIGELILEESVVKNGGAQIVCKNIGKTVR